MFGYVMANKPELKVKEFQRYRACYCGLCRQLREQYGYLGAATITYDMTFLILLLNSLYEPEEEEYQCHCILHPVKRHQEIVTEFSTYGADMNLILSYYKLQDDLQDHEDLKKQAAAKAMSLGLKKQVETLEQKYPGQTRTIRKELKLLRELETKGIKDPNTAAASFGRLLGRIFVYRKDQWSKTLYKIGYNLGAYIYLVDAWQDLPEDRISGSYNPLPYDEQTAERERIMKDRLLRIMAVGARALESLPLVKDVELIRNIIYSGIWTAFGKKAQKKRGCKDHDERSL